MKKLVIAEKPSVAQSIANVLAVKGKKNGYIENEKYIISWCIGHLIELDEPVSYDEKFKNWSNLQTKCLKNVNLVKQKLLR